MNQIPNIEEEEIIKEFERRMPLITSHGLLLEARLTPTNYEKMKDWLRTTLHQELQKARQDWLREEIVKLEGVQRPTVCHTLHCLKGRAENHDMCVMNVPAVDTAHNQALQTIIDRYHFELDQDNK